MTNFTTQKTDYGSFPNAFYRVSVKAIIRGDNGTVLCVKENGSEWTLPGGGMDHGETVEACLARELHEEVAANGAAFTCQPIGCDSVYLERKQAMLMWLVYEVDFTDEVQFSRGVDADEVAFIDPRTLHSSTANSERMIYKWCVDQTASINHHWKTLHDQV